jgi:tetratricopeptide (TPR) repeat protein
MQPSPTAAASPRSRWRRILPALILAAAIFLAYARVWHAGFIWDDDDHLTRNPCIIGPLGFSAIWTTSRAVYYPLVLTSFWVQHLLWGLDPLPYHVVDVALHAACAILLWRVLLRLGVPGAWLGAAIWALHPVQVESAAWITEQKNTQSCFFYLFAILFFLNWLRAHHAAQAAKDARTSVPSGFPRSRNYAAALLFATLAILSKSSTVMLPVVLALVWWWMDGRWRWTRTFWLIPFLMVSGLASAWTIWEQKYANHALGVEWSQSWPQRLLIAGKDIWFYLWKLAWPHPLTFIYPVWNTEVHAAAFLPLVAAIALLIVLWLVRNGPLRGAFFAYAYFLISLFPVLSLFNVYFFRYSFVGDHFQYLASIGPLSLAGAAIASAARAAHLEKTLIYPVACAAVLIVLGMLSYLQCGVYYNLETLWRCTLADNPNAWIAHFNLADILVKQGRLDEAAAEYRLDLQLLPTSEEGIGNLANVLLMQGHTAEAIDEYQKLLAIDPDSFEGHGNLSTALLSEGQIDRAIDHAQQAVALSRQIDDSGEGHNDPTMLRILATAYARAGRYPDAIEAANMALQRAESQANTALAAAISKELAAYEAKAGATR